MWPVTVPRSSGCGAGDWAKASVGRSARISVKRMRGSVVDVGWMCASGLLLWGEDGAVADLVFLDAGDGGVGVLHGEALGDRLDVVAGGDVEHLAEVAGAADAGAGD